MPAAASGWSPITASRAAREGGRVIISRLVPICLAAAFAAGCASARPPIRPVSEVDLPRFMGRWYVIASIPTRYERGGHNPVETYELTPDGTICTWFRLRPDSFDAPVKLLHSSARVVPGSGNGQWRVQLFAFFSAQYLVGWLKPDYSQVMVVRDARDYLWYMARTPQVADAEYQALLGRAATMGYDVARIVKAPQRWPETGAGSQTFAGACR